MERVWPALLLILAGSPAPEALPQEAGADAEPAHAAPAHDLQDLRFEGGLRGARDGEDFAETPGYRRLLDLLTRYHADELRSKVESPLDPVASVAEPEAWRGRIVRVRGVIAGLTTVRLNTRIGESQDVYRALLYDGERGTIVDFIQPPPTFQMRDVVDIEGVFFRTVSYESKSGTQRVAPYVIGRALRVVDTEDLPRTTSLDTLAAILCGATAIFLVVRLVSTLRKSRPRGPRAAFNQSIRERAARALPSRSSTTEP